MLLATIETTGARMRVWQHDAIMYTYVRMYIHVSVYVHACVYVCTYVRIRMSRLSNVYSVHTYIRM